MTEEWEDANEETSNKTNSIALKPQEWEDEDKDEVPDEWDAEPKQNKQVVQTHKPKALSRRKLDQKELLERKKATEEQNKIENDPILKAKLKKDQEERDKAADLRVASDLFGDNNSDSDNDNHNHNNNNNDNNGHRDSNSDDNKIQNRKEKKKFRKTKGR